MRVEGRCIVLLAEIDGRLVMRAVFVNLTGILVCPEKMVIVIALKKGRECESHLQYKPTKPACCN